MCHRNVKKKTSNDMYGKPDTEMGKSVESMVEKYLVVQ